MYWTADRSRKQIYIHNLFQPYNATKIESIPPIPPPPPLHLSSTPPPTHHNQYITYYMCLVSCLLIVLDAHMFTDNGYGPGTTAKGPRSPVIYSAPWALVPGPYPFLLSICTSGTINRQCLIGNAEKVLFYDCKYIYIYMYTRCVYTRFFGRASRGLDTFYR